MQYMGNNSATGSVTTKRELGLVVNDYFDYNSIQPGAGNVPQFVTHYWWDNAQNLFETDPNVPAGIDETFCRVRKVEVWVLPQARGLLIPQSGPGTLSTATNADQMYTVSCQVPDDVPTAGVTCGEPTCLCCQHAGYQRSSTVRYEVEEGVDV
jgi:hypothetical protein